jgi:hypothetical protein
MHHLLKGASHPVTINTDHKNLEYFMTTRVLNCRQVYWNVPLSRFEFIITYRPGKQQGLFDALSRWSYLAPKEGEAAYEQQQTTLLKAEKLRLHTTTMSTLIESSFLDQVRTTSIMDPLILDTKRHSDNHREKFKFVNNLLYFEERLYIP